MEFFGKSNKQEKLNDLGISEEQIKAIVKNPALFRKLRTIFLTAGIIISSLSDVEAQTPKDGKKMGPDSTANAIDPEWDRKAEFHEGMAKELEKLGGASSFLELEKKIVALQSAQEHLKKADSLIAGAQVSIKEELEKVEKMGSRPEQK